MADVSVADVVVREVTAADDLALAGAIVQEAYFGLPGYPRDEEYDRLLGEVAARAADSTVVIALVGQRMVGCLTYVDGHDSEHAEFDDADAASFRYFGVASTMQGGGVGEAMVRWCAQRARADGKLRLRIHTLESMPGAQRLYQRMGFERDPAGDEDWDGIKGLAFVLHL